MRISLVFPPRTGPTYMPLGIACLAAVAARKNVPLDLFDANLELWNSLCDSNPALWTMRDFARGPLTTFLNPQEYAAKWGHMADARRRIDMLEARARHYLAGEGLGEGLEALLSRQSARIARTTPGIVAFSAMYLDQLPFILAQAKYLVRELRSGCRVVIGGAAMSALSPVELLEAAPFVEAVLTGEGEVPFEMLLDGRAPAEIPGCFHRSGGGIAFSGKSVIPENLSLLSPPDFSQLAGGGYFNPVPVMPIYGCRGCKWRRCRFCVHNNSFGRYRQRPAMAVALEMQERWNRYRCRHFYVVDQYVDPVYLDELSNAILELGLDCRFQIMARTTAEYTPGLLHKAARAGCCWISWGMESGSQEMLDIMNKGTRADSSLEVIRNASVEGISNLLMMIFGAPGSTPARLDQTFTFLDRAWNYIDGMTASAFVLFDQTAFSRRASYYDLEILGGNRFLEVEGKPVHDMKLRFRRESEDGRSESPLAAAEIEAWERRKV
ncbi:MAG: radical SAM protein, partial [Victivallaceae bacterium]